MLTLAVTYAGMLGGAERTLVDFASELPGGVVLACPDGPLARHAQERGIPTLPLTERSLDLRAGASERVRAGRDLGGHALEIRRLVQRLQPDLVLAWGMRSAISASGALTGSQRRPALLIRHVDFLPGPLVGRLVRAAAGKADRVSANSGAVARDLDPAGRLAGRLSVTPPGVELDRYRPDRDPGPEPEVLVLGAVVPWKRLDLALEAVALAARELPSLRLTIAGRAIDAQGEALLASLRERANRPDLAGRVTFAGHLDDPREALERSWALLHCADREPFGSVVLQAMASGRPVVAPDAGGPAEMVDETRGALFPPGDAQAAAAALVRVLDSADHARSLGAAGRAFVQRFDAAAVRREFAALAVDAAGVPPGPAPGHDIALVTVTHNSERELATLLRSARRHLPGAHVVVVDSGSSDGSAELGRREGATVVELPNVGFGRATNAGVARASEEVCVLLNPDVELVDDSLAVLARDLMDAPGQERILAPRVLSPDGSVQDTAQLDPRSPLLTLAAVLPPALLPARLRARINPWRSERPRPVGWAVGCCIVGRTEVLSRLGPFDERIFLYAEDLELGLRAAEQGVRTWFRPDARVIHLDAHSSERVFAGEPVDMLARQRRAVIGQLRGPAAARRDHWVQLVTHTDRIVLKALGRRSTRRERRLLAAQWRARHGDPRL